MSMFDGFADALASVPQQELRFTFAEIEFFFTCLSKFQEYLDDREADEQSEEYGFDGQSHRHLLDSVWDKLIKYQWH